MKSFFAKIAAGIAVLLLCALAAAKYLDRKSVGSEFKTATIRTGELVATISATGTLEPEEVIDVGAQVAGQIVSFGKDENGKAIDYGSKLKQGMVLAQIDDSLYSAEVNEASAQLVQAQAGVVRAQADLQQQQAKLVQAGNDWDRARQLGPSDALAQTQYDAYKATYESAAATVGVSKAAVDQAQAAVTQAQAALQRAQRNLAYCTIRSPVDGVIIDRRVNIGQTVVSSLNAPSLFLIAKDLKRMQVWVAVNEADIGNIHPGQTATFTVDAFPGQTFRGQVSKIRLNASMTQNVVTYTVEVTKDNSSLKLLPYLTANVQFEVSRDENVLLVPNAAVRWTPRPDQIAADARGATSRPTREQAEFRPGRVWVRDGDFVKAVNVGVGPTDGVDTEIRSRELKDGDTIIIGGGETRVASSSSPRAGGGDPAGLTNPFAPQPMRGRGR